MRRFILITLVCVGILLEFGWRAKDSPPPGEDEAQEEAAAGDTTDAGTSAVGKLDVCAQLTREEVEAALGRPVREPTRGAELTSRRAGTLTSSCMFGGDEGFVSVGVRRQYPSSTTVWSAAKSYEELKGRIAEARGGEYSGRVEEVAGVGVDAFAETKEETKNYQTTELRALGKRSILTVRVVGPAATHTLEAARTLAATVIPRLEMYERDAALAQPESTPSARGRDADLNGGEPPRAREKSRNENERTKGAAQPEAGRNTKADSARAGKNNSRPRNGPGSGEIRKPVKETAKKTADKNTRPGAKKTAAKPQRKKRP